MDIFVAPATQACLPHTYISDLYLAHGARGRRWREKSTSKVAAKNHVVDDSPARKLGLFLGCCQVTKNEVIARERRVAKLCRDRPTMVS